ncbi:hypothetical protein N7462_007384 [Penicillium macrosclerotiorum]|uniref:uncharacterized protein n=1 Tax=Penicillium macrosclerotiorum TaxID=303699 RepID=UPI002549366B|nr:uncharacterized protein N7462_007384 [Penicillium macrosclerotiorum]KAJ5679140.1 hypothetical protein N7462_007384 [Penicillium macrosclerotiorum]
MPSDSEVTDDPNTVVIPVPDEKSDGDKATWPLNSPSAQFHYRMKDDSRWRMGLAAMWVEHENAKEEGINYILEKLPEGYALMDRPRGTNSAMRDAFLFGHPSGKYFQSRVTFFKHFHWLMTERVKPCECVPCARQSQGSKIRKRRTKAEMEADRKKYSQQWWDPQWPCTEEGPDYWKGHIMDLKKHGRLDIEINHPFNRDWVFNHELLENAFIRYTLQPGFIPRRGEVVLWTWSLDGTLEWNSETMTMQIKGGDGKWHGTPEWRAGVVTQVPEEPISFLDIVQLTKKQRPVTYSGFRVETLPHPNEDDKSYSLQYTYLPLKCIKPFHAFERFLQSVPREKFHPSIEHALTTMASYSLLHYVRFKGEWPNARIFCKGIYIGHELIAVKDTVRLKPWGITAEDLEEVGETKQFKNDLVSDVMFVERIWLQLEDCSADPKDEQLARSCVPYIAGKVYTRDPNRLDHYMPFAKDPLQKMHFNEVINAFQYVGMTGYEGNWYRIAGGKTCIVTPGMILGRCYEPEATNLHFGSDCLDYDLHDILSGRRYSIMADNRIAEGLNWFWGDYRVQTLGLATINGVEVGPAADQRKEPERWQAILRILAGSTDPIDVRLAQFPGEKSAGRTQKKPFREVSKMSKLVSSGLGDVNTDEKDDSQAEDDSESDLADVELMASIPFRENYDANDDDYEDE